MSDNSPKIEFIKVFTFALKQSRLYPQKHPITQQAIQALAQGMEKLFLRQKRIELGIVQKNLIVDGQKIGEKDAAIEEMARELTTNEVEGMTFENGASLEEVVNLIQLFATNPKARESKGGFYKMFQDAGFEHIRLTRGKFKLVREGEKVDVDTGAFTLDEPGAPPPQKAPPEEKPATSIADIIREIRQQGGRTPKEPPSLDCEKIVSQLQKEPKQIADVALEDVQDAAQIEAVIRRFVDYLVEGLLSFLVEQGKDITKALERLAREFEKALDRTEGAADLKTVKERVPKIIQEATNRMRLQMMIKTYRENHPDMKPVERMAGKLFKDKEVRDELGPKVQQELANAGMPVAEIKAIFDKIEAKQAQKKKRITIDADRLEELKQKARQLDAGGGAKAGAGTVAVDAKELEKLKQKAERFDDELAARVSKAVEKVEREKKVVLDEKERVDTVIRNLAEGLLVVDKNGKVVLMNPAAERMLGVKQSQVKGKAVSDSISKEHVVAMTKGDLKDSDRNVAKQVEVVSLNDETQRVLQASTAVVENEDGKTVGMVSVLSDITRQKELDELKTKFVSNVSHELRTPLVAIQKSLSLILEKEVGDINPEQQKFLSIAHRNIERLSRLINDLLDISKLEAGGISMTPRKIPVRELVHYVISSMDTLGKDKQIRLDVHCTPENVEIEADSDRLTQALTNLIGNALKFTPENGTITVEVKGDVQDDEIGEPCVEFGVKDSGIGISKEDQKRIFDKFVQVSLVHPAGVASTGLGLTITKEIVELHRGHIWVESEPGEGSRFAFRLPVKFKKKPQQVR